MKIILLSRGGFNNPESWSGTPYTVYKELKDKTINLEISDWQINRNILRLYHVIYGKLFFIIGSARDPLLHFFFKRKVISILKSQENKVMSWVLFIPDICIPDKIEGKFKFSVYTDALIPDMIPHIYADDNKYGKKYVISYFNKYDRIYFERMSLIFTQNEWTRQAIISQYSISTEKIINVGFGVNLQPYQGEKNYNNDLLLIVLRKGTEKYKGLLLLLEAFDLLLKLRPQVKLAVVGTDFGMDYQNVTCYYNQPREVTVELFQKATLYVMPALHEPNGITYLEALANKAPIVGLNRFALPEFSGYGEWGFIANNEDPLELAKLLDEALSDKDRLKDMGIKGQQFVLARYHWGIVVDKIIEAMNQFDKT